MQKRDNYPCYLVANNQGPFSESEAKLKFSASQLYESSSFPQN